MFTPTSDASVWDRLTDIAYKSGPILAILAGWTLTRLKHWLKNDFANGVDERVKAHVDPIRDKMALIDRDLGDARERIFRLQGWKDDYAEDVKDILTEIRKEVRETRDSANHTAGLVEGLKDNGFR